VSLFVKVVVKLLVKARVNPPHVRPVKSAKQVAKMFVKPYAWWVVKFARLDVKFAKLAVKWLASPLVRRVVRIAKQVVNLESA